jgi:hypothetical protein
MSGTALNIRAIAQATVPGIALPNLGYAQAAQLVPVDTEHIFGFTEGADIGSKGRIGA